MFYVNRPIPFRLWALMFYFLKKYEYVMGLKKVVFGKVAWNKLLQKTLHRLVQIEQLRFTFFSSTCVEYVTYIFSCLADYKLFLMPFFFFFF